MQLDELFCSNCLTIQAEQNFYCEKCHSTRLLSYTTLAQLEIAHIDCDAFYASVEKRDNPALTNQPVIISDSVKGVVATACYIARKFGIRSAMPVAKALQLCPNLIIIKPNMQKYAAISVALSSLLSELTPLVEKASIDEFFLDFQGTKKLHKQPAAIKLLEYQKKIEAEFSLSASIGVSYCKFLSKLASDMKKPNGFFIINKEEAKNLIAPISVTKIHGVGEELAKKFLLDKLHTISDIQKLNQLDFIKKYKSTGQRIYDFAQGIDDRTVTPQKNVKSVSKETSFYSCINDPARISYELYQLSEQLSAKLKKHKLCGSTIVLKIRPQRQKNISKCHSLSYKTNLASTIFETALFLLKSIKPNYSIRLLGITMRHLHENCSSEERDLLDSKIRKNAALEEALDLIKDKFGSQCIHKAQLIKKAEG